MSDPSIWRKYVAAMESIVGGDIRGRSRKREMTVGRAFVAYQLRLDGWTLKKIGLVINRDHATVMNAIGLAKMCVRGSVYGCKNAPEIWSKFQIKINENEKNQRIDPALVVFPH